jgi:hypothetical protein
VSGSSNRNFDAGVPGENIRIHGFGALPFSTQDLGSDPLGGANDLGLECIMSSGSRFLAALSFATAAATGLPASAADLSCSDLVPIGNTMTCPFEPNWSVGLSCSDAGMTSVFVDAFSGPETVETPGSVTFHSEQPWGFDTEHGVGGSIDYTPDGCLDESDRTFDFTLTTNALPGYSGDIAPICCTIESTLPPEPPEPPDDS